MPVNIRFCPLLIAAGLLFSPVIALAEDCPKDDLSPMCEDMRAQAVFEQTDHQLNVSYQQLIKKMSQPKDEYLDYPALKTRFVEAQRQWVRFRDKECDAWYLINQAGAQRNTDQMACLIQRTKDRTAQLKEWIIALP
ncbi:lysozyme inhibitor LprI family protein [Rahnella inusitata]|uniref:lysozyme inhibitor LprI family protein n=1 Tax=Rahnella inusitata TaxID=58169 RepID=UPI0039BEC7A8